MSNRTEWYEEDIQGLIGRRIVKVTADTWAGRITHLVILLDDGREIYWQNAQQRDGEMKCTLELRRIAEYFAKERRIMGIPDRPI